MSGLDYETHRILGPDGELKALVFTVTSRWIIMRRRLSDCASTEQSFRSMGDLEKFVRRRRWRLEEAGIHRG